MTRTHAEAQLSERSHYLFKMLVERYIADGQPVGSRTLARDARLDLSPATIRNVMADLEDLGSTSLLDAFPMRNAVCLTKPCTCSDGN